MVGISELFLLKVNKTLDHKKLVSLSVITSGISIAEHQLEHLLKDSTNATQVEVMRTRQVD